MRLKMAAIPAGVKTREPAGNTYIRRCDRKVTPVRLEVFNGHDGDNHFNSTVTKAPSPRVTVGAGKRLMPGDSIFLTIGDKDCDGKTDGGTDQVKTTSVKQKTNHDFQQTK